MSGVSLAEKEAALGLLQQQDIVGKLEKMVNDLCRSHPTDSFAYMVSVAAFQNETDKKTEQLSCRVCCTARHHSSKQQRAQ